MSPPYVTLSFLGPLFQMAASQLRTDRGACHHRRVFLSQFAGTCIVSTCDLCVLSVETVNLKPVNTQLRKRRLSTLTCDLVLFARMCFGWISRLMSPQCARFALNADQPEALSQQPMFLLCLRWISVLNNAKEAVLLKAFGESSGPDSTLNQSVKELTRTIIAEIRRLPGNRQCCDCGAPGEYRGSWRPPVGGVSLPTSSIGVVCHCGNQQCALWFGATGSAVCHCGSRLCLSGPRSNLFSLIGSDCDHVASILPPSGLTDRLSLIGPHSSPPSDWSSLIPSL